MRNIFKEYSIYVEDLNDIITNDFINKISLNYNVNLIKIGDVDCNYSKQDLEIFLKSKSRFLISSYNPNHISRCILIGNIKNIKDYVWEG